MYRLKQKLGSLRAGQAAALDVEYVDVPLWSLPPPLDGYRMAVVSDLHFRQPSPLHERIVAAVKEARPGVILVAGDTMDEKTGLIDWMEPFFRALSDIAPTVAILGNNDCLRGRLPTLRAMYRRAGVILLENETRYLNACGVPLQITGLMDITADRKGIEPEHGVRRARQTPLSRTITSQTGEGEVAPSILLVHQPQLASDYAILQPSLIVSGHAHGGQLRLPLIGGLYAPGQGLFPRYTSGLYSLGMSQLLVSRGLGNHRFPLRVNNPLHLPVIVLRPRLP